jgi:hypothetical protein
VSALLEIAPARFGACFGREPFVLRHALSSHPLFALEKMLELARTLPAACVEYNAGDLPVSVDPRQTPRNGLSAEETLRRIAQCRSWLVLKNVEQDHAFRELLETGLAGLPVRGAREKQAFIFVSSPEAVTPYHMDPEENFLLQIRGTKTMHVFDRELVPPEQAERFFCGAHRNLEFRDEYAPRARVFELGPGSAVHVPVGAPHWVRNGPEVSISFSMTFQTPASKRRAQAHRLNARLRRLGMAPSPVGRDPVRDAVKQMLYRVISRVA